MTRLLAQILLAFVVIISSPMIFLLTFIILEEGVRWRDELAMAISIGFGLVYLLLFWMLLWKSRVRWTSRRKRLTMVVVLGSIILSAVLGILIGSVTHEVVGYLMGGFVWVVLYLGFSIVVWRETAQERAERITQSSEGTVFCHACGYNMTGLHEARCPECGNRYTLNELYAAQNSDSL